ncbi:hypothetical protein B0H17DRAFT_1215537 [Mycena rosella]|uniref:Chromo domain-containing protein n=1 Tax=Mycena rosella TaxID=1033263 RepID=A0AAD7CH59_MYCRO|nr:hypothetical protein B0H17DRAFT_1215537 [Mycena rosella]
MHVPNDDPRFPGRLECQLGISLDSGETNEWAVDRIVNHYGRRATALFEILWKSGDHSWMPYSQAKKLQAMNEYLESVGVSEIRELPYGAGKPPADSEELMVGSTLFHFWNWRAGVSIKGALEEVAPPSAIMSIPTEIFTANFPYGRFPARHQRVVLYLYPGMDVELMSAVEMRLAVDYNMAILNYDTVPQNPPVGYVEFTSNMNRLDNSKQFWVWLEESSSGAKVIAWDTAFDEAGRYPASATSMRVRDDEIVTRYVSPTDHIISDVWFRHAELLKEEDVRRRINGEAFRNNKRRRDGSAPDAPATSNKGFARHRTALAAAAAESDARAAVEKKAKEVTAAAAAADAAAAAAAADAAASSSKGKGKEGEGMDKKGKPPGLSTHAVRLQSGSASRDALFESTAVLETLHVGAMQFDLSGVEKGGEPIQTLDFSDPESFDLISELQSVISDDSEPKGTPLKKRKPGCADPTCWCMKGGGIKPIGDIYTFNAALMLQAAQPYPGDASPCEPDDAFKEERFLLYSVSEDDYIIMDRQRDSELTINKEFLRNPDFMPALWYAQEILEGMGLDSHDTVSVERYLEELGDIEVSVVKIKLEQYYIKGSGVEPAAVLDVFEIWSAG